jgi:hypothetical protein
VAGACALMPQKETNMRKFLIAWILVLFVATIYAKPMTGSVKSWEGDFKLKGEKLSVQIEGKPKLFLWLYQLDKGSKGTCIGFSRENGDMILAPNPNEKGIQPVYTGYVILFSKKDIAEIIVFYDVQGNGAGKLIEKYTYDGKVIKLTSRSQFFGRHEPVWKNITGEQTDALDKK